VVGRLQAPDERQRDGSSGDRNRDEVDLRVPRQHLVPSRARLGDERDIGGRQVRAPRAVSHRRVSPSPSVLHSGPQTRSPPRNVGPCSARDIPRSGNTRSVPPNG
jgi:hypothetical protein